MQHVQALRQKRKEDKKSGGNNWESLRSPSRCCLMYRSARTGKKRRKLQGERRRRQAWPRHASKSTSVRRRRGPSCQGSKNRRGVKLCNGNDARRRKSPGRRGRTKRPGRRQQPRSTCCAAGKGGRAGAILPKLHRQMCNGKLAGFAKAPGKEDGLQRECGQQSRP